MSAYTRVSISVHIKYAPFAQALIIAIQIIRILSKQLKDGFRRGQLLGVVLAIKRHHFLTYE